MADKKTRRPKDLSGLSNADFLRYLIQETEKGRLEWEDIGDPQIQERFRLRSKCAAGTDFIDLFECGLDSDIALTARNRLMWGSNPEIKALLKTLWSLAKEYCKTP